MKVIDGDYLKELLQKVNDGERPDIVNESDLIDACPVLSIRDILGHPTVSFEEVLTVICTSQNKTEMLIKLMELPIHQ